MRYVFLCHMATVNQPPCIVGLAADLSVHVLVNITACHAHLQLFFAVHVNNVLSGLCCIAQICTRESCNTAKWHIRADSAVRLRRSGEHQPPQ